MCLHLFRELDPDKDLWSRINPMMDFIGMFCVVWELAWRSCYVKKLQCAVFSKITFVSGIFNRTIRWDMAVSVQAWWMVYECVCSPMTYLPTFAHQLASVWTSVANIGVPLPFLQRNRKWGESCGTHILCTNAVGQKSIFLMLDRQSGLLLSISFWKCGRASLLFYFESCRALFM